MIAWSNPFASEDAARRYAAFRPDYSRHLAAILAHTVPAAVLALDVAAGTGISTAAFGKVASRVVAVDASPAMIAAARRISNADWVVAGAEDLPFRDGSFDLIGVGSALHWFHRDRFVAQATRVAAARCHLVVHDHGFTGRMDGVDGFSEWMHHRYQRGYPAPPRGEKLAPGRDLGPFRFLSTHRYDQAVEVTRDDLAGYLTTQSNLQVVMTTAHAAAEIRSWLEKELDPFFAGSRVRVVRFTGMASILRRT